MTEARKATTGPPDLDLYALAQVRIEQILNELPACRTCKGDCRPPAQPVLGRKDWPTCPVAMVSTPPWTDVARVYVGAQVSPITGFPWCMTAWGFDAVIALRTAIRREDERQQKAASRPDALPAYRRRTPKHEG